MSDATSNRPLTPMRSFIGLAVFLGLCATVAAIGGAVTAQSVDTWYQTLNKPAFNPPDWVFGPVWTTLYILMAVAAWRVWRLGARPGQRLALMLFLLQLALNLAWSFLFFGQQWIGAAFFEILVLWAAILQRPALPSGASIPGPASFSSPTFCGSASPRS